MTPSTQVTSGQMICCLQVFFIPIARPYAE